MLLGSRFAAWGKATLNSYSTPIPRQPLLSLYPIWIRESSTSLAASGSSGSLGTSKEQAAPAASSCQKNSTKALPQDLDTVANNDQKKKSQTPKGSADLVTNGGRRGELDGFTSDTFTSVKYPEAHSKSLVRRTGTVGKVSRNRRYDEKRLGWVRQVRQELAERKGALRGFPPPVWRETLSVLQENTITDQSWLEQIFRILVPDTAVHDALYGIDDTIREITGRYGCSVDAEAAGTSDEQHQSFLLSGPALWLKRTLVDIRRASPGVLVELSNKEMPRTSKTSDISTPLTRIMEQPNDRKGAVRNVVSEVHQPLVLTERVDQVPQPTKWTARTFANYVEFITAAKSPGHLNITFPRGTDHQSTVVNLLHNVFTEPKCLSSFSRKAFNTALQYLVKHHQIFDARVLFMRMDTFGLKMDPETFNIMLRQAARMEDLHSFMYILRLMLRRKCLPNGNTWIAFLMSAIDPHMAFAIATSMMQKGLLQNVSTLKGVVERVIGYEINGSLDKMVGQDEFISYMDTRYGPKWVSIDSCNSVLDALGTRGLISRCRDFLHFMESRFIRPDMYSVNIITKHCKRTTNMAGAVEFLQSLPPSVNFSPDEATFQTLFEMAWNSGSWNVARVVWKYGCMSSFTSSRMRIILKASLRAEEGHVATHLCNIQAALFVATPFKSVDFSLPDDVDPFQAVCESIHIDFKPTETSDQASPSRITRRRQVGWLIRHELRMWERWEPRHSLIHRLAEALRIDRLWNERLPRSLHFASDRPDRQMSWGWGIKIAVDPAWTEKVLEFNVGSGEYGDKYKEKVIPEEKIKPENNEEKVDGAPLESKTD